MQASIVWNSCERCLSSNTCHSVTLISHDGISDSVNNIFRNIIYLVGTSLRCYWWRNAFVLFCSDYRIVFVCLADAHYRERNNFITLFLEHKLWRSYDETLFSIIESIAEWVPLIHELCNRRVVFTVLYCATKRLPVTHSCTLTLIRYTSLIYTY